MSRSCHCTPWWAFWTYIYIPLANFASCACRWGQNRVDTICISGRGDKRSCPERRNANNRPHSIHRSSSLTQESCSDNAKDPDKFFWWRYICIGQISCWYIAIAAGAIFAVMRHTHLTFSGIWKKDEAATGNSLCLTNELSIVVPSASSLLYLILFSREQHNQESKHPYQFGLASYCANLVQLVAWRSTYHTCGHEIRRDRCRNRLSSKQEGRIACSQIVRRRSLNTRVHDPRVSHAQASAIHWVWQHDVASLSSTQP